MKNVEPKKLIITVDLDENFINKSDLQNGKKSKTKI